MATKNPLTARLKYKVIIQSYSDSIDASGGPTGTWVNYLTRYASVVPLNGNEFFTAQTLTVDINVRIRLRYDALAATITSKHRVLWGSRIYDITTVINPKEANREIVLMCQETP